MSFFFFFFLINLFFFVCGGLGVQANFHRLSLAGAQFLGNLTSGNKSNAAALWKVGGRGGEEVVVVIFLLYY